MGHWWVSEYYHAYGGAFVGSWVFWIVFSICLHELSHGWAAIRCGDDTPRYLGHMTWNPFVHMPLMSWIMFAIVGITWGLMPVNPSNFRRRHDDALVAFAGPVMNVGLAAAAFVCAVAWQWSGGHWPELADRHPLYENVTAFFMLGGGLNMVMAVFNLIPAPPLDGSRIAMSFVGPYRRFMATEHGPVVALVLFIVLFNSSIGDAIFGWSFHTFREAAGAALRVLPR